MKRMLMIGVFLAFTLVTCTQPANTEPIEPVEIPSQELSAIDSLMWQQPDSALAVLIDYFSTGRAVARYGSTNDKTFDNHYAHLLLAELLYKNDYAQTNRMELLRAVAYFDSLLVVANGSNADTRGVSLQGAGHRDASRAFAQNIAFLDARTHYINGVGYYEHDSVVEACAEYLKALETMEGHFMEKEMMGKKAKFMVLANNRLGDMFSERFMMDPAIFCYKNSFAFSCTSPLSSYSIPNALYRIGKQFAMKGDRDSANYYYSQAITYMPDTSNLYYRDIISSQSLLSYQLLHQAEPSLQRLKQMAVSTENPKEKLNRSLVIGDIYFEEKEYDSALVYLQSVFDNMADIASQVQAAEYLRILYDSLGEIKKSDFYIHFLAIHKPMEYETDAKISNLSELFKNHLEKKQKRQSEREKHEERILAINKTIRIIVPISIMVAVAIYIAVKLKNKKLLKRQQAEATLRLQESEALSEQKMTAVRQHHAEIIEAERQNHMLKQAALSGRLKQSNQELRDLKEQIKQQNGTANHEQAASFAEEPICRLIMERVHEGQFLSQMDCTIYRDYALNKNQLAVLRNAVDCHFNQFTVRISKAYPELTRGDLDYCCLYLLGLTDADVAALMQRAYNTVNERNNKLRRIFGSESPISVTLQALANKYTLI